MTRHLAGGRESSYGGQKHSLSKNSSISRKTQKQMFLLVSGGHFCAPERDTNMASPYKALKTWVKRFSEYLAYELLHRPDSWQAFCIFIFFHFPDSRLSLLKGFYF